MSELRDLRNSVEGQGVYLIVLTIGVGVCLFKSFGWKTAALIVLGLAILAGLLLRLATGGKRNF